MRLTRLEHNLSNPGTCTSRPDPTAVVAEDLHGYEVAWGKAIATIVHTTL